MEKSRQSEFSKSYKLKTGTVDRKSVRLHRRSIDWKNFREDQVNKRRNIDNLSPLQEISQNSTTLNKSYKDKTPVKRDQKTDKPQESIKDKLKKWREEKQLKKKLEALERAKKKPFKITHLIHSDAEVLKKDKADKAQKLSGLQAGKNKSTNSSATEQYSIKKPSHLTSDKNNPTIRKPSKSVTQGSAKVNSNQQSSTKAVSGNNIKQPVTGRVTRSSSRQNTVQQSHLEKGGRHSKQASQSKQSSNGQKKIAKNKENSGTTQNSNKVTTRRLESFAPEEFSFIPPDNLSSFVFQPLTPNTAKEFLFFSNPDETASCSFISNDPDRCSTPKRTKQDDTVSYGKTESQTDDDQVKAKKKDTIRNVRRSTRNTVSSVTDTSHLASDKINNSLCRRTRAQKSSEIGNTDNSESNIQDQDEIQEASKQKINTNKKQTRSRSASLKRSHSVLSPDEEEEDTSKGRKQQKKSDVKQLTGETQDISMNENTSDKVSAKKTGNNQPSDDVCDVETEVEDNVTRSVVCKGETDLQISVKFTPEKESKATAISKDTPKNQPCVEMSETKSDDTTQKEPKMSESDDVFLADNDPVTEHETFKDIPNVDNYMVLTPSRCTRSARRSLAMLQSNKKEDDSEKSKTKIDLEKDEVKESPVISKKPRNTRKSIATTQPFVKPDSAVRSAKRANKKRRRTECDGLATPKSPEEWVKLLQNSPMVEMSRRPSKPKSPVGSSVPAFDLELDLDDLQLPPKESVKDEGDISLIISANLLNSSHSVNKEETDNIKMDEEKTCEAGATLVPEEQIKETTDSKGGEHDVEYFRNLLKSETDRLNNLAKKWEDINNETEALSEEVRGQLRTVTGQAHLLVAQRFKQFRGLVDNCEFGLGEKETTCTDLQGFWDMIYYQVEDVHIKFDGLDKLKNNNWIIEKPEIKKVVKKKPAVTKPTVKKPVKSKFAAFRAQMKKSQNPEASLLCNENPVRVFDAGFFKVSSPVKSPKPHCEAGSPKPKSTPVPTSEEPKGSAEKRQVLLELPIENAQIRTPTRKSYVPVVPSPLLKDTTPQPRLTRSSMPRSIELLSCNKEKLNNVDKIDVQSSEPLTTPSVSTDKTRRKSVRRSLRTRKSVSFCDTVNTVEISGSEAESTDTNSTEDLFQKYLEPANTRLSMAPEGFSIIDSCLGDEDNSFSSHTEENIHQDNESPSSRKRTHTNLKQLPSQKRRRSLRRSVTICSPVLEEKSDKALFSPVSHPPSSVTSDSSEVDDANFPNLNIGYTPKSTSRRSRPSLLYTPPDNSLSESTTSSNIPTGVLISFTP